MHPIVSSLMQGVQDVPFPTIPEGLQSVCSLSLITEQLCQSYINSLIRMM